MRVPIFTLPAIGALVTLLAGCFMPRGGVDSREGIATRSVPPATRFDKLWADRTIVLGAKRQGGGGMPLSAMLGMGGDRNDGEGPASFPLTVQATIMDSALVAEGVREYGKLAAMTNDELTHFDSIYRSNHPMDNNIFIWIQFRTQSTEDFLQMDKWTIFLENDEGMQLEPERTLASPIRQGSPYSDNHGEPLLQTGPLRDGPGFWSSSTRDVELYFHRKRSGGGDFLSPDSRNLKLIILENTNPLVRSEGVWEFSRRPGS